MAQGGKDQQDSSRVLRATAGRRLEGWAAAEHANRLINVKADPDYVKIQQLVIIKTSSPQPERLCASSTMALGKKLGLTDAQEVAAAAGEGYMTEPAVRTIAEGPRSAGPRSSPT